MGSSIARSTAHPYQNRVARPPFLSAFSSSDARLPRPERPQPYVVVIFGRTGVGISSLVNLIVGHPVSDEHPNARTRVARAPKPTSYPPILLPRSNKQVRLHEVPGFCGHATDATLLDAIREIDQREGIDMFVYCLRSQKTTVMPDIVRRIRESGVWRDVPMIAVVTELERFEAEDGMEGWWDAPLGDGSTNGRVIERMCFRGHDTFEAHACITTLPRREVDLVEKLRKRREVSEERIRRLLLEHCTGHKRPAPHTLDSYLPCQCLSTLFNLATF